MLTTGACCRLRACSQVLLLVGMGMWHERVSGIMTSARSPTVTESGSTWGLPLVLARLAETRRLGWLDLRDREHWDQVALANELALALNRATESKLFNQGLSTESHLERLRLYARELTPFTLAVTGAENSPELVAELLSGLPQGVHLFLDYDEGQGRPSDQPALPPALFKLLEEEAMELAPAQQSRESVLADLARAGGWRPAFMNILKARLGQPLESVPAPSGALRPHSEAELHSPSLVISALMRQKRYEEALELAVQAAPRLVERVLPRAGPEYQRRGQLQRLHLLLSSLDDPWVGLESALEWRLVAGVAVGDYHDLLWEVDEFLEAHQAPDLRARRAALLSPERRTAMAHSALVMSRTPLTLWQAGRMSKDPKSAITLLQESVRLAEDSNSAYDVARNAGSLAEAYLHAGELRQSLHWSDWALSVMDEAEIGDANRRARITNNLAFAGILTGETLGLRRKLEDALHIAGTSAPDVVSSMRLTLAALSVAEGDARTASQQLELGREVASRRQLAGTAHQRAIVLLALNRHAEAAREVEQARAFAAGEHDLVSESGQLGQGMLLALAGDPEALDLLRPLYGNTASWLDVRMTAWLYARLLGEPQAQLPASLVAPFRELAPSGLRILSAPASAFAEIWSELSGSAKELDLKVLGEPEARLAGQRLKLTRRMWEVLLVIALHPRGIGDEQLLDYLVRDSDEFGLSALRSHVSRVRQLVKISDTPYRLEVPYSLDLLQLREAVRAGELRRALKLARGPLLPGSRTAGIEELRADTAALLENAVLHSSDAEAVYSLAEELAADIGLWERSRELLPASDTRRAVANANIQRLRQTYD